VADLVLGAGGKTKLENKNDILTESRRRGNASNSNLPPSKLLARENTARQPIGTTGRGSGRVCLNQRPERDRYAGVKNSSADGRIIKDSKKWAAAGGRRGVIKQRRPRLKILKSNGSKNNVKSGAG